MTLPLIYDGQVVGIADLQSDRLNNFTRSPTVSFASALADSVAAAVHNADLYRTERWRRQVADSLREVAGISFQRIQASKTCSTGCCRNSSAIYP